jgi:hypothetical protein
MFSENPEISKTLISEKKNPFYPFLCNSKSKQILGVIQKSKVVDLVLLYNFGFWGFQSFSIKVGVILKRCKS